MAPTRVCIRFWTMCLLYFSFAAPILINYCEARKTMLLSREVSRPKNPSMKHLKILEMAKNLNMLMDVSMKDASNYVSSPLTLPPYDSLPPVPLPDSDNNNNNNNNNNPPYCVYPPPNPQSPPSTTIPSPVQPNPNPPPNPIGNVPSPTTPEVSPYPPTIIPGPPDYIPSPPTDVLGPPGYAPNPPYYEPSPPENVPSPIGFEPSPPVFEPPVVYPPPTVPPPSSRGGTRGPGVWCVAKPSVPDPIIQEAMNYACGSGADCGPIQPNGSCFEPNTLLEHASYAFNSYWQRTKVAGGTCSFGGTAMLVTVDPSSEGCHFVSY